MEYTRLKITYPGYAKRFYRIIAIKGDPDLPHLGAIIAESMRADFEHCWLFETKQASYEPDCRIVLPLPMIQVKTTVLTAPE